MIPVGTVLTNIEPVLIGLVAPDAVDNPYDLYQLPMPERVETRIIQISDAAEVVALSGFDVSWCQLPPR